MKDEEFTIEDQIPRILGEIEKGNRPKVSEVRRKYTDRHAHITDLTPIESIPPIEESTGILSANPSEEEISHFIEYPLRSSIKRLLELGLKPFTSSANKTDLDEKRFKWHALKHPAATIGIIWDSPIHHIHPSIQNSKIAEDLVGKNNAFFVQQTEQQEIFLVLSHPIVKRITAGEIRHSMESLISKFTTN